MARRLALCRETAAWRNEKRWWSMDAKTMITSMLAVADIRIGGDRPWDIQVHNPDLYRRVLREGTLGVGESYMEGWWDCDQLDVMFCRAIRAHLEDKIHNNVPVFMIVAAQTLFNLQSVARATMVAEQHYNTDNAMFARMLGPTMNYSCGYWKDAATLDEAQTNKMELICRKLDLREGMTVLDIGCGWGGLSLYMAEHYGVKVTAVTVSSEQFAYAREHDAEGKVNWVLEDYRSIQGRFDRIVSVGMFEHVGRKNYAVFMDTTHRLLDPSGLFLLHTIGSSTRKSGTDPWINKYIFPNGMLPSPVCIGKAIMGRYVMEDWHNFGADYDKTLMAWHERFEAGYTEGAFQCSERVRRMYRYYLLSCAGAFRARDIQLWQIVLSPQGVEGGYCCAR